MPRMLLLLISLLSGLGIMGAGESVAKSNEIDVSLEIVDEQGRGVPYATIWSYLLPRENPLAINAADLVRVTTRYQSSFEFAIRADSNRPVTSLKINPMGDAFGRFQRKIDYRQEEGSEAKRPEKMSIGYAVMKRGYLPAFVDFSLTRESSVSGKVVLKSDPRLAPESQPYLVKFERLRYELSDQRLNVEISEKNHQRMERLRMELEETARQALEVGDKRAAARIYARMEYLPSIRFIGGKPAGFSQADPAASKNISHTTVGVTTAGKIREAGGTVTVSGRKNHATVSGVDAKTAESIFKPNLVKNPNN